MKLFNINDEVKITADNAHFLNNKLVPDNALNTKLFIRNITDNGYVIGRAKTGPVLGEIDEKFLKDIEENEAVIPVYAIRTRDITPLYNSPSKNSGVIKRLESDILLTIVNERSGFGKIRMGAGWVELAKVDVLKK